MAASTDPLNGDDPGAMADSGEAFHRYAVNTHLNRLVELCHHTTGDAVTDDVRLAAADAFLWAHRLHFDVLADSSLPGDFANGVKSTKVRYSSLVGHFVP